MKYPCIETTLDYKYGGKTLRLWIEKDDTMQATHPELTDGLLANIMMESRSLEDVYTALKRNIPRLNAAQVIDETKEGPRWGQVVYYVDFDKDPHG